MTTTVRSSRITLHHYLVTLQNLSSQPGPEPPEELGPKASEERRQSVLVLER